MLGCWALIPIRLVVGYAFIAHGYSKLIKGPEHFSEILHVVGAPHAAVHNGDQN